MTTYTRREAGTMLLGALAATQHSVYRHVQMGVQSYSYRTIPLDQAIAAMVDSGIDCCELNTSHIEPSTDKGDGLTATGMKRVTREELRKWREETPLSYFSDIGKKFRKAGVRIYAFNYSFKDDFSDAEIARGFEMAKALGAKVITASGTITVADRVQPVAAKNNMLVGMHNHSSLKANEYARPEDFAAAMKGHSHIAINLDIGHFVAAGFDPVEFLSNHAAHIVTLHIKDRKRNQGPNMPFGEGDTPIKQVLQLLRDRKLNIPANIEYEYDGGDAVREVKKCLAFCKAAIES